MKPTVAFSKQTRKAKNKNFVVFLLLVILFGVYGKKNADTY